MLHPRGALLRQSALFLLLPLALLLGILLLEDPFLLGSPTLLSLLRRCLGSRGVRCLQEGFLDSESILISLVFALQYKIYFKKRKIMKIPIHKIQFPRFLLPPVIYLLIRCFFFHVSFVLSIDRWSERKVFGPSYKSTRSITSVNLWTRLFILLLLTSSMKMNAAREQEL